MATTKPAKQAKPAAQAPAAAKPVTVALRGGPAVQMVQLTGKPYRTAAAHNQAWWQTIVTAGPQASVAAILEAGVPAHFVGYAIRRGYLQAADAA